MHTRPLSAPRRVLLALLLVVAADRARAGAEPIRPEGPPPPETPASASASGAVGLVYAAPGCPDSGTTSINLVSALFDHFIEHLSSRGGAVYVGSTGTSALLAGDRVLVAPDSAADALAVGRFLADAAGARREVLERDVPVLDGPYELMFQYPYAGHFDWVDVVATSTRPLGAYPDTRQRRGDVVRYTSPGGRSVLALEMRPEGPVPDAAAEPAPPAGPPEAWAREFTAVIEVAAPDDHTRLYSVGHRLMTAPRMVAELAALRRPGDLFLHPGGLGLPVQSPTATERLALCAKTLADLHPDALVPREAELALGPEGLRTLAGGQGLPYVAANLTQTADGKAPFPRFRLFEREGRTIAVIGLVDRDQVSRLPASMRTQWAVERPTLALDRALEALRLQLRRPPDLTVVLFASQGESWARVLGMERSDLLLGLFPRFDLLSLDDTVVVGEAAGSRGGREGVRARPVLMAVEASESHVGRVQADFEGDALRRVSHTSRGVLESGPRDAALEHEVRALEEREVPDAARVLLPDVAEVLKRQPELAPLVWGQRILHRTGFRDYPAAYPGRFSDPLWMRFVTNRLREATDAEVALSRNLPRAFDTVGRSPATCCATGRRRRTPCGSSASAAQIWSASPRDSRFRSTTHRSPPRVSCSCPAGTRRAR